MAGSMEDVASQAAVAPGAPAATGPGRQGEPPAAEIIACHICGHIQQVPAMASGAKAQCAYCGSVLYRRFHRSVEWALALNLAALCLFLVANLFPVMTLEIEGNSQTSTLVSGATSLFGAGLWPLGLVVLLAGTLMPALKLATCLYLLIPLHLGGRPPLLAGAMRLTGTVRPWAMMEVYLLGLIVAYVKLGDLATLTPGPGLLGLGAFIVVTVAADRRFERHEIWGRVAPQAGPDILAWRPGTRLVACHACDQLVRLDRRAIRHTACPRCAAPLHRRKPRSLSRCAALVVTGAILYIPANVLPIMTVIYFGAGSPNTILSGVAELAVGGMWPIALLVLAASVLVPMLKLVGLTLLMLSVRRRWQRGVEDRTRLYRLIEQIGRWSMIDIFMIAILTALVRLGTIANVQPDFGAVAFAAVVIVTMFAAMAFDPRLMWDALDERRGDAEQIRV